MRTALTQLLQIEYPIIQGAMAWVSEHKLVAAVANAGATGVIALGGRDAEWTRNEIRACKDLTDKPFGVNLMLMAPNKDELVDIIIEEKPAFVTLGAGNPVPYIKPLQDAGIKVIPVVPSLKLAKRIEEAGADAIIIEGMEAGGHIGSQTTMSLMENILPEISIPVVVAGAIVDGRGIAAALLMGAEGVQMGSRFLLAEECQAHINMKEAIIKATDTDSVVTGLLSGHGGVRSLKNEFTTRYLAAETDGVTTPEERTKMSQGTNKRAAIDGDVINGAVQVGQGLNRLTTIEPAHTIVQTVMNEAILGDYVTIGHGAIVHASTIEDNVLVGMGAIVLSGCHIGSGSIIAAGAVIKENTVIPPNSLVVGIPARIARTDETQIERIHNQALKYKHLWTVEYGMLPDAGGEEYDKNAKIV